MNYRSLMEAARAASTPDDASVARVRDRLADGLRPIAGLASPQIDAAAIARVRGRVRERSAPPAWGWGWAGGGVLAAAALALLMARSGDAPVADLALAGQVQLSSIVQVTAEGTGRASGVEGAWTMDWEAGTLHVDVVPNQGANVVVSTREARVEVVGTVFDVRRDVMGTHVSVARGQVRVTCLGGGTHELTSSDTVECGPTSAAGLLGRAAAMAERGAPHEDVLAGLDAAEALPGDALVQGEILAARLSPLLALGRHDDARRAAEAYLALPGGPREAEVRAAAASLALAAGDCEGARRLNPNVGCTP